MSDIKNPFSFGTGDIDKDLWLRDIDNEQEDFITRYGSATNKHRTALLRQAFQDLRTRIANGDMLNRTADGQYQFGSALIRDDKHMQEAYQRALGFMGDLARRQLNTPAPEPEKKKFTGSTLEDEFKKSLGPDGRFNEKAYWARTPEARGQGLLQFLTGFKNRLNDYQDFSSFTDRTGLESKLDAAIKALNDKKYDDWSLSQLGFTNDWINKPVEETTEQSKSNYEQAQERYNAALQEQQTAQLNQQIQAMTAPDPVRSQLFQFTPSNYWTYDSYARNLDAAVEALKETDANGNIFLKAQSPLRRTPNGDGVTFTLKRTKVPTAWNGEAAEQARTYAQQQYNAKYHDELNSFFKGLGVNYQSYLNNSDKLKALQTNLAKLFTVNLEGNSFISPGTISKYFVQNQDGTYGLKGSNLSYDPTQGILYQTQNISNYKEGGIIKGEDGLIFDSSRYINNVKKTEETPKQAKTSSREMTAADIAAISADLGSIVASFVPGYGTAASAVLGVGSTLSNFISDVNDSNTSLGDALWTGAKGLGADAVGLIPGFGAGAKGWKIATRLAKYGTGIMAGLSTYDAFNNSPEMMKSFKKILSLKVNDMDLQDWRNVQNGLSILATASRAGHGVAVHKGYKGQLKVTNPKKPEITVEPKTRTEKAKAKIGEFRDKFKGKGDTYDYGGPNNLPWYHDANIYLWGANRSGFNMGLKNPYKVDMSSHMKGHGPKKVNTPQSQQLQNSPMPSSINDTKIAPQLNIKAPNYRNRNMGSVNKGTKKAVYVKKIGGILKALRNGGIIKAAKGVQLNPNAGTWYNDVFSNYRDRIINQLNQENPYDSVQWLNNMQSSHANIYKAAGNNFYNTAYQSNDVKSYQQEYDLGGGFFEKGFQHGFNDPGIAPGYANRYIMDGKRVSGDKPEAFKADGLYSAITDDRRLLGRRTETYDDWTPEDLNAFNDSIKKSGYKLQLDPADNYYKLVPFSSNGAPESTQTPKQSNQNEDSVKDKLSGIKTPLTEKLKDPFDPTLLTIAGKTLLGLRGNRDIYGNLLKEMPQAPLRDPIDRKLAIVGWQEQIKQGQNQLADLRNIYGKQTGSDAQVNLAGALEVEGKGRDIMNDKFMKDSERQFAIAQRSWDIDNDDYLRNNEIYYQNDRALKDRARMMAQIRAAWRSGDNNILMGGFADASNWLLKRYQREQDVVDRARGIELGTPESRMQERLVTELGDLANKKPSEMTAAEITRVEATKAKILRQSNKTYASDYYNMFHVPGFGGGYYTTIAKDGTKLEVEKLKARGKDNDRYVSMIKDLRQSSRRRRRR